MSRTLRDGDFTPVQNSSLIENNRRRESRLIKLIDHAATIKRYEKLLHDLETKKTDVPGFLKAVAIDAAIEVLDIMHTGDTDKTRLAAAQDILDRAGYNKTSKIAVAGQINVDHDVSKMELINLILSSAKRAGIKVKNEEPIYNANPLPEVDSSLVVDVTPSADQFSLPAKAERTAAGGESAVEVHRQGQGDQSDDCD